MYGLKAQQNSVEPDNNRIQYMNRLIKENHIQPVPGELLPEFIKRVMDVVCQSRITGPSDQLHTAAVIASVFFREDSDEYQAIHGWWMEIYEAIQGKTTMELASVLIPLSFTNPILNAWCVMGNRS